MTCWDKIMFPCSCCSDGVQSPSRKLHKATQVLPYHWSPGSLASLSFPPPHSFCSGQNTPPANRFFLTVVPRYHRVTDRQVAWFPFPFPLSPYPTLFRCLLDLAWTHPHHLNCSHWPTSYIYTERSWIPTSFSHLLTVFSPRFTCPEDGGDTFLRNIGSNHNYTAPDPRRRLSTYTSPWKPQILQRNISLQNGCTQHFISSYTAWTSTTIWHKR
jgi:hypothetical protein